ncbi:MAG: nuclear transport factor 2 family protein [Bacteroidota bacterium]
MRQSLSILLVFSFVITYSQSAQNEIDEQVWKAFTKDWETNDSEGYNAVHSDDVWRINPGRLLVGDEYKNRNSERMKGQEKKRIIEFSFETRTTNGNNAYEVGYYRITDTVEAKTKYYVGRFHVALKKINDRWKISQDWATDEINGITISPERLSNRFFIHFE